MPAIESKAVYPLGTRIDDQVSHCVMFSCDVKEITCGRREEEEEAGSHLPAAHSKAMKEVRALASAWR